MSEPKTIGLVFVEGFADWEFGFLSASAVEWFGAKAVSLSPGGQPVASMAGLKLTPERGVDPGENDDLDAVAVIGSDSWAEKSPPDIAALLLAMKQRGGVIGGICAGTLPLARAGLFDGVAHTSNGRDWILAHEPSYAGADGYRDVPNAVADRSIVSAPGSAPGTFAVEFLRTLYPDQGSQLAEMKKLFAREHSEGS